MVSSIHLTWGESRPRESDAAVWCDGWAQTAIGWTGASPPVAATTSPVHPRVSWRCSRRAAADCPTVGWGRDARRPGSIWRRDPRPPSRRDACSPTPALRVLARTTPPRRRARCFPRECPSNPPPAPPPCTSEARARPTTPLRPAIVAAAAAHPVEMARPPPLRGGQLIPPHLVRPRPPDDDAAEGGGVRPRVGGAGTEAARHVAHRKTHVRSLWRRVDGKGDAPAAGHRCRRQLRGAGGAAACGRLGGRPLCGCIDVRQQELRAFAHEAG